MPSPSRRIYSFRPRPAAAVAFDGLGRVGAPRDEEKEGEATVLVVAMCGHYRSICGGIDGENGGIGGEKGRKVVLL